MTTDITILHSYSRLTLNILRTLWPPHFSKPSNSSIKIISPWSNTFSRIVFNQTELDYRLLSL